MKYIAFIYQDKDDVGFTAVVPDLPGCVSYGDTFEEVCSMIQEAAELWLEGERFPVSHEFAYFTKEKRKELEIPIDALTYIVDVKQDKNVRINIMFSATLLKEADKAAQEYFNGNRSAYLQNLVAKDLQNHNITL